MELSRIGRLAKDHWEKHRPKMVKHLKAKGVYQEALQQAQERATDALVDLISLRGVKPQEAWELVMKQYILLPGEEETPRLKPDQMPFSQPNEKTIR